jgi:hypothetical protein
MTRVLSGAALKPPHLRRTEDESIDKVHRITGVDWSSLAKPGAEKSSDMMILARMLA